uniref:TIR domain-containing protein n=1 Tax=Neogobius melanostomus TaxID=47308 RepID=A0A8C6TIS6_9GOBI
MPPEKSPLPLFSLLFLLLLPRPSWLYSLHNCSTDATDSRKINCSEHKLSRIPSDIPKSAKYLSVYHNNIQWIRQSDFSGLSELQTLKLGRNQISHIEDAAFSHLSSLTELYLDRNRLANLTDHMFTGLSNLTVLGLRSNKINHISELAFAPLTKLLEIVLWDNLLSSMSDIVNIVLLCPLLKSLDLTQNPLTSIESEQFPFPLNITKHPEGLRPLLSADVDPSIVAEPWGNSLTKVPLTIRNMSSLTFLSFQSNLISKLHCLDFSGLHLLKILDLSYNALRELNSCAFQNLQSLQELYIEGNKIHNLDYNFGITLLNLMILDASGNYIEQLLKGVFRNMTRLTELDLQSESVTEMLLYEGAFDGLTDLRTLSMSPVFIIYSPSAVFEALPSLRYLDLSDNPFACNCSNADFIDWVIRNTQVYVNRAYQYKCESPESHQGALLLEFDYRWCWESVGLFCFLCSSALVLLTLFLTFLHHFLRFHLLYGFYLLRAFLYHRQQRGCAEIYDAFVSYNVHDEEWVYRELLPELEGRQGWKLCLHHRDFEPGKAIMDNIVDAIYSSRKTLCVISHQYLLSEWCSREIQMARCCSSSHTLSLVIGEVHFNHQKDKALMRSRTYLSWSGARGHRGLFWERVRHALQSGAQLPADDPLPTDD